MRFANVPESAGTPGAKSAPVSVLPDLVVQIYRNRSPRAGAHIPHRLSAEDEMLRSELLEGVSRDWK